jgi:hypothetical protein
MLRHLDISGCGCVGEEALRYVVEGCPNLQHLDVSGIPMSDGVFQKILTCKNLKSLFLTNCDLSKIKLDLIPKNIPGLLHLFIGPRYKIGYNSTRELSQHMPHLKIKDFSFLIGMNEYWRTKNEFVHYYFRDGRMPPKYLK